MDNASRTNPDDIYGGRHQAGAGAGGAAGAAGAGAVRVQGGVLRTGDRRKCLRTKDYVYAQVA